MVRTRRMATSIAATQRGCGAKSMEDRIVDSPNIVIPANAGMTIGG
jgi:hypothetical protein